MDPIYQQYQTQLLLKKSSSPITLCYCYTTVYHSQLLASKSKDQMGNCRDIADRILFLLIEKEMNAENFRIRAQNSDWDKRVSFINLFSCWISGARKETFILCYYLVLLCYYLKLFFNCFCVLTLIWFLSVGLWLFRRDIWSSSCFFLLFC